MTDVDGGGGEWQEVKKSRRQHKNRVIQEDAAWDMQRRQKIRGLAKALMSAESQALQRDGYHFVRVVKGNEMDTLNEEGKLLFYPDNESGDLILDTPNEEGRLLFIADNEWGDYILFCK